MATFEIEWRKSALKDIKRLDQQVVPRIISAIDSLVGEPFPVGVRKLMGTEYTYRIQIGDYRVIYEVFEAKLSILIIRVRHRKEVYRQI